MPNCQHLHRTFPDVPTEQCLDCGVLIFSTLVTTTPAVVPTPIHEQLTALLDGSHCPKHMEWEKCCLMEVSLDLHNKIMQLIASANQSAVVSALPMVTRNDADRFIAKHLHSAQWEGEHLIVAFDKEKLIYALVEEGFGAVVPVEQKCLHGIWLSEECLNCVEDYVAVPSTSVAEETE